MYEKYIVLVEKIKKEERIYNENVKRANEVFMMKQHWKVAMTIWELKLICNPVKKKGDGKMLNKKASLIQQYKECPGRPAPSFDDSHLVSASECDYGYNIHDNTESSSDNDDC